MKLTFLGTRANIEKRSQDHQKNAACLVSHGRTHIMIDCGEDWLGCFDDMHLRPQAILITHAHPDHVGGLTADIPCPVYATRQTWADLKRSPVTERRVLSLREPCTIGQLTVQVVKVVHALTVATFGYRIAAGTKTIFYVPDVAYIPRYTSALKDVDLYIGDGARIQRSRIFARLGVLFGHASIRNQLRWCAKAGVPRALFTHCGTEIVTGGAATEAAVAELGHDVGVAAAVAKDGMVVLV
jgi:ribonuclease BN (tRNA processing enzyme)